MSVHPDQPEGPVRLRPQVAPVHYLEGYDTEGRFISYWHQADLILRVQPSSVLEVGSGSGFLARYLRQRGTTVTTVDFDPRLGPSVVGELTQALPFADRTFDTVACFEVLEHIPWEAIDRALVELVRVARRRVVISVPDVTPHYHVSIALPLLGTHRWAFTIPWTPLIPWRRPTDHRFDGQHHWELGKRGFPARRLLGLLSRHGVVIADFRPARNPFHHFFVLGVHD